LIKGAVAIDQIGWAGAQIAITSNIPNMVEIPILGIRGKTPFEPVNRISQNMIVKGYRNEIMK
jgi:hypothetical protein